MAAAAALALLSAAGPAGAGVQPVGIGECTVTTELARSGSCTIVADSTALVAQCHSVGGGTGYYWLTIPGQPPGEPEPCESGGVVVLSLVPQPVATVSVTQTNASGHLVATLS
jgi:hypothetical protein